MLVELHLLDCTSGRGFRVSVADIFNETTNAPFLCCFVCVVARKCCVNMNECVNVCVSDCVRMYMSTCCICSHAQTVCTSLISTCLFSNIVGFGIMERVQLIALMLSVLEG